MLHSIVGLQNSGKTLYMTYLLFLDYLRGRRIISNYDLSFPHSKINRDYLLSMIENKIIYRDISFGFDELWIWLDSRQSTMNTVATYFFLQSSKDSNKIYSTAQTNSQNDIRFRKNLHFISQCERNILYNGSFHEVQKFITDDMDERELTPELQNLLYIHIQEFKRVNMGFVSDVRVNKTLYLPAKPIFNLFDTRQKVTK